MAEIDDDVWTGRGKVRARATADGGLCIVIEGLTTQAKYYKPLVYEFFRKEWRGSRPATGSLATRLTLDRPLPMGAGGGEFAVEIVMEYLGDPPWMDLDNLAKALLDAIKGYAFHDDAQVGRLLVERHPGERERITITVSRR